MKMSQTLLMFSLMLQPLLIQYVSNGCGKIAVICEIEFIPIGNHCGVLSQTTVQNRVISLFTSN